MTRWQMFTEALDDWRQHRLERRALKQANALFARLQPQWHEAMFDEVFLGRFDPRTVLELDPRELAIEWTRQFSYSDPRRREREIRLVTGAAAHFQQLLALAISELEERRASRQLRSSQRLRRQVRSELPDVGRSRDPEPVRPQPACSPPGR